MKNSSSLEQDQNNNYVKNICTSEAGSYKHCNRKYKYYGLLFLIIIISSAVRLQYIFKNPTIEHDEAISYLAATGNQKAFHEIEDNKIFPYGEWVIAGQWKRFLRSYDSYNFKKIQSDLAVYDVHPPFYIWILHLWIQLVGVNIWTGPLLNVIFYIFNVIFIYLLSRYIFNDKTLIFAAVILFSFNPGTMSATFIARNYELFTLFSISFLIILIILIFEQDKHKLLLGLILTIIIFFGVLTHYYFGLFAISSIIAYIMYARMMKCNQGEFWDNIIVLNLASLVAFLMLVYIHPGFYNQLFSFNSQGQSYNILDFINRLLKICLALSGYFVEVERRGMNLTSIILLTSIIILFILSVIKYRKNILRYQDKLILNNKMLYILLYTMVVLTVIGILYISFFTHQAVMGPRYLAPIFPILTIIIIMVMRKYSGNNYKTIYILIIIIILSGTIYAKPWKEYKNDTDAISKCSNIIIDNTKRGVLLVFMMHIPKDMPVYCAMQDDLIRDNKWIKKIERNSVYLNVNSYGNTNEKRDQIINILSYKYNNKMSENVEYGIYGLGKLYKFQ